MLALVLLALLCACSRTLDGAQNLLLSAVWPPTERNLAPSVFALAAPDGTPALATVADDHGVSLVTAAAWCDLVHSPVPIMQGSTVLVAPVASWRGACLLRQIANEHELGLGVVWYDPTENPPAAHRSPRVYADSLIVGAPVYRGDGVAGIVSGLGPPRVARADVVLALLDMQRLHAQSLHAPELDYNPEADHEQRQTGECSGVCE